VQSNRGAGQRKGEAGSLKGRWDSRAPVIVGLASSFVVSVYLVRALRPALLTDSDPGWALPRFLLWLFLIAATATAGGAAAGLLSLWSRSRLVQPELPPFPATPRTTTLIAMGALAVGLFLRIAFLGRLPIPFTNDEVNLITPTLALTGTWRDFADSVRGIPYGVREPHEMIGVVYLYLLRASLAVFGPTAIGLQALSALGGVLSLFTAATLGRALLPRGGAALTCLVLAGLRWHLILSLRGWHAILLTVLADVAALGVLLARRRGWTLAAFAGGIVTGVGAHLYFSAWIIAAALLLFLLWPSETHSKHGARLAAALAFGVGVLIAASPLFLLREGRRQATFERVTYQNVFVEMRHERSPIPLFAAVAEPLVAPWFVADPEAINDLPGRWRLGWIVGIPVALALARSLLFPRQDLSALLLAHAFAAFAAAVVSGEARNPHGTRYAYLTTLTAVAAAGGILQLLAPVRASWRRASAMAAIGLLSISGVLAARDALAVWPSHRATFESYAGQNTIRGLAAARWEQYGRVAEEERLGYDEMTVQTVARYRLDPFGSLPASGPRKRPGAGERLFRIVAPEAAREPSERVVERVRDGWGREWAIVLGRRTPSP
jgi:hypothetical protein